MSNVRALPVSDRAILIGEQSIDRELEAQAETLARQSYPNLSVITTPQGKKQIPLYQLVSLERRFQDEISDGYRKGFADGRQSGHHDGMAKGQEEARQVVSSLSGLVAALTGQRDEILAEAKERILEMVLKISRRLTFGAASLDPEISMAIIAGAIEQLRDKSRIKIRVNPDHLPILEQQIDRFRGPHTAIKEFAIEPDPRVKFGGCFIETPSGDIDARLESMFEVIERAITTAEEKKA